VARGAGGDLLAAAAIARRARGERLADHRPLRLVVALGEVDRAAVLLAREALRRRGHAVRIARASVELSPRSSGLGLFDPRAREALITEEDLRELRTEAESGRVDIDYWKGRPVKLTLKIEGDHISISLNAWADRWDTNATNTIPDFAVTALGKVLAQASA
jgi:hypothetical protein